MEIYNNGVTPMNDVVPIFSFRAGEAHIYYNLLIKCNLPLQKAKVLAQKVQEIIDD